MSALRLSFVLLLAVLLLAGCLSDAATRLAYDIKAGAARVGAEKGAHYIVEHRTPSRRGGAQAPTPCSSTRWVP